METILETSAKLDQVGTLRNKINHMKSKEQIEKLIQDFKNEQHNLSHEIRELQQKVVIAQSKRMLIDDFIDKLDELEIE